MRSTRWRARRRRAHARQRPTSSNGTGRPLPGAETKMGKEERSVWTCLPTGMIDNHSRLSISVFISPQLLEAGILGDFTDFVDWPTVIREQVIVNFEFWNGVAGAPTVVASRDANEVTTNNFGPP